MIRPDIQGVSLIGVPTDVGAGTRGARMGPEALRVAGLAQAIEAAGDSSGARNTRFWAG